MTTRVAALVGAVISATLVAVPVAAGTLAGVLREAGSGVPLPLSSVALPEAGLGTVSGDDGTYAVASVPAGAHAVRFSHIGYGTYLDTVEVAAEDTTRLDAVLMPSPST